MAVGVIPLPEWLESYDCSAITIAVVASHPLYRSFMVLAKKVFEHWVFVSVKNEEKMYSAFPGAEPDEWLVLDDYKELMIMQNISAKEIQSLSHMVL